MHERLLSDYVLLQEDMRVLKHELNECRDANDSLRRELQEKTEILNLILEKERDARELREFETEMTERAARGGLHMYIERQNALIEWLESHTASSEPPSSSDLLD
jgi:ATP-dependent Lon protease